MYRYRYHKKIISIFSYTVYFIFGSWASSRTGIRNEPHSGLIVHKNAWETEGSQLLLPPLTAGLDEKEISGEPISSLRRFAAGDTRKERQRSTRPTEVSAAGEGDRRFGVLVSGVDFDREDWRRDLEEPWEWVLSLMSVFVLAAFLLRFRNPEDDGAEMLLVSLGDETATKNTVHLTN